MTIVNQNATGKFSGQDFTITEGSFRLISDKTFFSLYISPVMVDLCSFPQNNESILFSTGKILKEGVYTLNNLMTVSFNTITTDGANVELATCGEITETNVRGTIVAEADAGNTVNGNFTASICK